MAFHKVTEDSVQARTRSWVSWLAYLLRAGGRSRVSERGMGAIELVRSEKDRLVKAHDALL
jgi:hypothetical protein